MRNQFSGFYGISEDAVGQVFTSEDTIFIFDTNILLTLYRCEEETRNQFFEIWGNIKEQCWFPHQVCLEYQRNRLKVVSDSRGDLGKIPKKMNSAIDELKTTIFGTDFNKTISRYSNLKGEIETVFSSLENMINTFSQNHIEPRKENIDFIQKHDVIRDDIDRLTEGRIGPAPMDQQDIDKLNKLGKIRYDHKVGPGYEDLADKKDKFYSYNGINYHGLYGDFYVWNQVLDYVESNHGKNIVYVTNDAKSDFFFKIDGKIRGPNESLITEIKSKGATEFLLQNIDTFLHHANTYLNADVNESVIKELTNASNGKTKNHKIASGLNEYEALEFRRNLISFLDDEPSKDMLYELYGDILDKINSITVEINELSSTDINTISLTKRNMLLSKKKSMMDAISIYRDLLAQLSNKISFEQEKEAIAQLRENL